MQFSSFQINDATNLSVEEKYAYLCLTFGERITYLCCLLPLALKYI